VKRVTDAEQIIGFVGMRWMGEGYMITGGMYNISKDHYLIAIKVNIMMHSKTS
jgi:hypothetical protein